MNDYQNDPTTIEAALMTLSPEELSTGLRILSKLQRHIYTESEAAGVSPVEWDAMTAPELLESFEEAIG